MKRRCYNKNYGEYHNYGGRGIKICKKCPLFTDDLIFKGKCDAKKYYNPETNELSNFPGKGFISGCGCKLSAKTRIKDAKCVLKKW